MSAGRDFQFFFPKSEKNGARWIFQITKKLHFLFLGSRFILLLMPHAGEDSFDLLKLNWNMKGFHISTFVPFWFKTETL